MDDYLLAVLLFLFVLIPLAGLKITGMVKKIQKMSSRGKKEDEGITLKQKEFIEFLKNASNQSKRRTMPDVKSDSDSDDVGMKLRSLWYQ